MRNDRYDSRIERLVYRTSWGKELDHQLVTKIGKFVESVLDKEGLRGLLDLPTELGAEDVAKLSETIFILDNEKLEKSPMIKWMGWKPANTFRSKLTALGLINGVIKNFLGPNYKMIMDIEDDGSASRIWIGEEDADSR